MDANEKRQLETELVKNGFAGLDILGNPSGELIQQIAAIVNMWQSSHSHFGEWIDQHTFLRDLLNQCEPEKRATMYEAIKPHLTFKPHPLPRYEAMISEKAGNMVSQRKMRVTGSERRAINVGNQTVNVEETSQDQATHALIKLCCQRCGKKAQFLGDTPVGAMLKARKKGWWRDLAMQKEYCPKCAEKMILLLRFGSA